MNTYLPINKPLGILLLRIFIGLRLLYGVVDNVFSWERMLEFSAFLEANSFPVPIASAVVSVYVQFLGSIMLLIGFKTRFASLVLTLNFIVAVLVHVLAGDSIEGMTPALAMLFGCLTLLFTGAEKFSLDDHFEQNKA